MTETQVVTQADVEVAPGERVEDQYVVRLLFKFDAPGPGAAVERMIAELADHGLRQWNYRVEKISTGELFFVNGYGEVKTIDQIVAEREEDDEEDEGDDTGADQS